MIDTQTLIAEYVRPAIELWQKNQDVKHLAVHAITQLDVLAEIVALLNLPGSREKLTRAEARKFRDNLDTREPVLAIIRDAHDSHKHGKLDRQNAAQASKGQRPEMVTKYAFFADHTPAGGPLTPYNVLVLQLNDGTEKDIYVLLNDAMAAWERELTHPRL